MAVGQNLMGTFWEPPFKRLFRVMGGMGTHSHIRKILESVLVEHQNDKIQIQKQLKT